MSRSTELIFTKKRWKFGEPPSTAHFGEWVTKSYVSTGMEVAPRSAQRVGDIFLAFITQIWSEWVELQHIVKSRETFGNFWQGTNAKWDIPTKDTLPFMGLFGANQNLLANWSNANLFTQQGVRMGTYTSPQANGMRLLDEHRTYTAGS